MGKQVRDDEDPSTIVKGGKPRIEKPKSKLSQRQYQSKLKKRQSSNH